LRWCLGLAAAVVVLIFAVVAVIYFRQHSMIYHPRPYDASYTHALPSNGVEINYTLPAGKQTAYYIPGREQLPKRLWVAFCGNGSLALDWTTILRGYPDNGDAFLLVDYPGYGKNAGYATTDSTRAGADAALRALTERLYVTEEQLTLCTIGHSLGSAVALDFAAHHRVQRVVAIAAFTTLREEAATVVGGRLSRLLIENYDNRASLREVAKRNPGARIAIFHGVDDGDIPVRMGRELAKEFPFAEFFAIEEADHVSVLTLAKARIIDWMNR
jgi:pimeloyl-ACP methyl ester carboxylesterase